MNRNKAENNLKLAALAILGFSVSIGLTHGQVVVNAFNTAAEAAQWRFDFGIAATTWTWDSAHDANGNPASGSLSVAVPFDQARYGPSGNNKIGLTTDRWYPGLSGADYSSLDFDIRIDPNSAPDQYGLNGYFSMVIRNTDNYNYITQFGDNVGATWKVNMADGWRHVSVPLTAPYDHIRALTFQLYGDNSQNITGDVILNIDNIVFVPEPSTMGLFGLGALGALTIRRRILTAA